MSKYNNIYSYNGEKPSPLVEGENVILNLKPKKSAYIFNQIISMMPVALLWLAFDSFFIAGIIGSGQFKEMMYFVIPFFAIHLLPVWIWIGNIMSANKKWKNTKYYVTDKRIIIENGFFAENYQTIYYKDIKNVYMRRGLIDQMLGVGDIHFDLGRYNKNQQVVTSAFLDIEKPTEIYSQVQKIIMDIQTDIEYPNALRPDENPGYNTMYKG